MIPHPTHGRDGRPTNARGGIVLDPSTSTSTSNSRTPFSPGSLTSPATGSTTRAPTRPSHLLRIILLGTHDPTITRLLAVPAAATAHDLHRAIQVAFGWTLGAASCFRIFESGGGGYGGGRDVVLREEIPTARPAQDESAAFGPKTERRWSRKVGVGALLAGGREDEDAELARRVYNAHDSYDDYDDANNRYASSSSRQRSSSSIVHVEYLYGAGESTWHHAVEPLGRVQLLEAGYSLSGRAGTPPVGSDPRRVICVGGEGHPAAEDEFGAEGWEGELKPAYGYRELNEEEEEEDEEALHIDPFLLGRRRGHSGRGGVAYDGRHTYDDRRSYDDHGRAHRGHRREDEDVDASDAALRQWYETECTNGDPLGLANGRLWCWDRDEMNRRLALLPALEDLSDRHAREVSVAFAGLATGQQRGNDRRRRR